MKLPQVPPGPLTRRPGDLHLVRRNVALWRVHLSAGPQVTPWDQLRFVGPTASRFDPRAPPTHVSSRGVTYAGLDVPTVIAEMFQLTRVIDTHRRAPYLTRWQPTRTLSLLDLTGTWPLRNGALHLLTSGPKRVCRQWAQAINGQWPDLDGSWSVSTMTGHPMLTLFTAAADAFPARPSFSRPLTTPALRGSLRTAAEGIGYRLV